MSLDANGDGSLTISELSESLKGKENGDTILQLMKSADTDGSGGLNYTEFLAATIDANIFSGGDYWKPDVQM